MGPADRGVTQFFYASLIVFVVGSFIPAIPEVAEELGADVSVVRYAYTVFIAPIAVEGNPRTIV
jgi:hypothetical protein